ncbi:hypothetical protein QOZ80_6AG0518020 [Eleusine coracana subsp. coracana]|nr:hypothetical protein QOZ80_6AG0518020 [Eleusine coracana subsp. coracana]
MTASQPWPWHEPPAPAWFLTLVLLGAVYSAVISIRGLAYVLLCLRRPKDLCRRYGPWAVVTGLTSGIGWSMAMELAARGINLILLDLDAANLREISDVISSRHGVKTRTVVFDLSLVGTAQGDKVMRRFRDAVDGLDVGVLVNNAGVARPYALFFHEADAEAWVRMIRVNLWALTEVTAAVLPGMVARGHGAVVNMGSASSEALPSFPLYTIYASTKRYVAQFSRSLYVEYKSKGIDVQCQAPFFVATRMVSRSALTSWIAPFVPTADAYARAAARWIGYGPLCSPTAAHQLLWCLAPIVPDAAFDWILLQAHQRQRATIQKIKAARAASASLG